MTRTREQYEQLAEQSAARRTRRRHRRILFTGIAALLIGAIGIQFLPYGRDHTNPPVTQEPPWDSPTTRQLAALACFDCHSNETIWPWYSNVAPMSMMIYRDVVRGREVLNFSEWDRQEWTAGDSETLAEVVAKGQMPLPYYLILHPEAKLTAQQEGQLINGLLATLAPRQRAVGWMTGGDRAGNTP
jgi:hypothetical protein